MSTLRAARIVLLLVLGPAVSAASVPGVRYVEGRLSAHVEGADPAAVLREVAQQAGLQVRGTLTAAPPVSVQLDAVPLADALPRLLAGQSFLLTYGNGGRLKGVTLLGGADAAEWIIPPGAPGVPDAPPEGHESGSLAASHRPVTIGGRLARAVGSDRTSFSEIMGIAMRGPSPRVRADALRVGLRIVDAEPELRADLLQTLDGVDDAFLAAWLAGVAGEHAVEIASRTARSARSASLRLRAAAVERLFRSGTPPGS